MSISRLFFIPCNPCNPYSREVFDIVQVLMAAACAHARLLCLKSSSDMKLTAHHSYFFFRYTEITQCRCCSYCACAHARCVHSQQSTHRDPHVSSSARIPMESYCITRIARQADIQRACSVGVEQFQKIFEVGMQFDFRHRPSSGKVQQRSIVQQDFASTNMLFLRPFR